MNIRHTVPILVAAIIAAALPANAENVKLKFGDLAALSSALSDLDGIPKAYDQGEGHGFKFLREPFDFSTPVRISIAHDLGKVKVALQAFEDTRMSALNAVSPGAPEKVDADHKKGDDLLLNKFTLVWTEKTKEPISVDLELLSIADLNLDKNKALANATIDGLSPILKK